ncbi:hypothetical protein D3C72_2409600 [compost metagenome]
MFLERFGKLTGVRKAAMIGNFLERRLLSLCFDKKPVCKSQPLVANDFCHSAIWFERPIKM